MEVGCVYNYLLFLEYGKISRDQLNQEYTVYSREALLCIMYS